MQIQTSPEAAANLSVLDFQRPRIEAFRQEIVKTIPCDEIVRVDLMANSLSTLLIHYMNWKDRFLAPRAREVRASRVFIDCAINPIHVLPLNDLKRAIAQGSNLTPHLSEKIEVFGYVRPSLTQEGKRRGIEWADKDYALNAYDVHHLHLGTRIQKSGRVNRTRALLFANFTRNTANLFLLGNHKSFDDGTLSHAVAEARAEAGEFYKSTLPGEREMTVQERTQLHRRGICTSINIGGKVVQSASLSTAGTSLKHTMYVQHIMRSLQYWEPLLDVPEIQAEWFSKIAVPPPEKPYFQWCMHHCDLAVYETCSKALFALLLRQR